MRDATKTFMGNLKKAVVDRQGSVIGGGTFLPSELADVLHDLQEYEQLHDAATLLNRIENIESSQATLAAIATRTETRLCKLIVHLGAAHLIESSAR